MTARLIKAATALLDAIRLQRQPLAWVRPEAIELRAALDDIVQDDPRKAAYRKAAQAHARDGELEIDDDAVVSMGDDPGAYVQAWLWVDNDEANICSKCGEPFEEGGDGFDGMCPSCADKEEEAEE